MLKRTFIVILACMMCLFIFAACTTQSDTDETTEPTSTDKTKAPESTEVSGETEETDPVTLYVSSTYGSYSLPDSAQQENVHQAIIDAIGVDVVILDFSNEDYLTRVDLALSAGDRLDVIRDVAFTNTFNYYNAGATCKISREMLDENMPNYLDDYSEHMDFALQDDGYYAGVPIVMGDTTIKKLLFIRQEWAESLTGGMPTDIESFDAYLEAVLTGDPNGNGEADEIPFLYRDLTYYIEVFAPAYLKAGGAWYLDDDENLIPPEMDPNYPALLAQLKEWMDKGYVYEDNLTADISQLQQLIAQNKVGAAASTWSNPIIYNAWETLAETDPNAQYEMTLVEGSTGNNQYPMKNDMSSFTLITDSCENPEAALRLIDWSVTEEGYNTLIYGLEGDNYVKDEEGFLHFINEDGTYIDTSEADANYNFYYMIHYPTQQEDWECVQRGMLYMIDTWRYSTMNTEYVKMKELPQFEPVDWNVNYNTSAWESASVQGDLETFLEEQKVSILLGDREVSDWDSIMDEWKAMGGAQMIADKTAEFNEQK